MKNKNNITDCVIWLMIYRIFNDMYGFKETFFCFIGGILLYIVVWFLDEIF